MEKIKEFLKNLFAKPIYDECILMISYANNISYSMAEEQFYHLRQITGDPVDVLKEKIKNLKYQAGHIMQYYLRKGEYPDNYQQMMFFIIKEL